MNDDRDITDPARSGALHEPPPGAGAMNVLRWVMFGGLLVIAVISTVVWVRSRAPGHSTVAAAADAKFHCPMHPTYTSARPGECPICGMALEPIPTDTPGGIEATGVGDVPGLTTVHLTAERIQMIGVRTARVEARTLGDNADLVGFVMPDETRLRRVQLRVAGWVERLHVNRTGEIVRAGQPLVTIYSPELLQTEQEFLIETAAPHAARDSSAPIAAMDHEAPGPAAARERLRLFGVPDAELRRLERERVASTRLTLLAPVSGTVLERTVTEGQSIGPDTPLLTLADLSRVWIVADVYEMDLGRVRTGDMARFTADALPGRTFQARVEFVYPTVSNDTRTLKVRFALDNPQGALRPGMYGRVAIANRGGAVPTVPTEALVRASDHNYVFLARAGGTFEPRAVDIGLDDGDRVQIVRGVSVGDTVVASASFLIDSESRLKAAIAGMGARRNPGQHQGHTP